MPVSRRMISSKIMCSDTFRELPFGAQALYAQLVLQADDDGFVNNAQQVRRACRMQNAQLDCLIERGFLLEFDQGIVVITHWLVANTLKKIRLREVLYPQLAERLYVGENLVYTETPEEGCVSLMEYKRRGFANKDTFSPLREEKEEKKEKEEKQAAAQGAAGGRDWFSVFYNSYPEKKRGDRESLRRLFPQNGEEGDRVCKGLECWKRSSQWQKTGGRYIPRAENFLKNALWLHAPPSDGPSLTFGQAELEAIRRVLGEEVSDHGGN